MGWIEGKHYGPVLLQLGARLEHIDITLDSDAILPTQNGMMNDTNQKFTPISLSSGLVWDFTSL